MRVRAKFFCVKTGTSTPYPGQPKQHEADFRVSYDPDFHATTPSGSMNLGVTKQQYFEDGVEYYVTIERADEVDAAAAERGSNGG